MLSELYGERTVMQEQLVTTDKKFSIKDVEVLSDNMFLVDDEFEDSITHNAGWL